MSEFVIMPKEHYEGACDAIREKIGSTDLILSGDMENNIRSIETGIDMSEANVTSSDLAKNVVAYGADGNKVTGNVETISGSLSVSSNNYYVNSTNLKSEYKFTSDRLFRNNSSIGVNVPLSSLGDASDSDVASNKTFTSSAGLKVTGKLPEGSPNVSDGIATCVDGTTIKSG